MSNHTFRVLRHVPHRAEQHHRRAVGQLTS
jgi:hypothetical protein